jgi:hypothetical protein
LPTVADFPAAKLSAGGTAVITFAGYNIQESGAEFYIKLWVFICRLILTASNIKIYRMVF